MKTKTRSDPYNEAEFSPSITNPNGRPVLPIWLAYSLKFNFSELP